jgi:protein ImuB
MFAVLRIPLFGLHAALRERAVSERAQPLALLGPDPGSARSRGKAPILELTAAAKAAGVRAGMTATQALARCPRLTFFQKDVKAEASAQADLLAHAAGFTPDYENTAPGVVTLDLTHVTRLAGDNEPYLSGVGRGVPTAPFQWARLAEDSQPGLAHSMGPPEDGGGPSLHSANFSRSSVARVTARDGVSAVLPNVSLPPPLAHLFCFSLAAPAIGFASTPDLARLAAHLAETPGFFCFIPPEAPTARTFLAPLPLDVLRPLVDAADGFILLRQWGLRTLGDLAALPRDEIVRRLGPPGGALWDYAAGKSRRLLRLVHPSTYYAQRFEFEHPVETVEPLLFILRRLLETLCARLASSWLVAQAVRLTLHFENGLAHHRELRVAEPCTDVDLLFRLLHTHLDGLSADAPISAALLELTPTRPSRHQARLFENSLRDPNRLAETLSQLETVLGTGRVGTPVPLPTRRADAFDVRPFLEASNSTAQPRLPHSAASSPRLFAPLRRFRPPLNARVTLVHGRPAELEAGPIRGPILAADGPWRLSGDWWDNRLLWQREEWDVWLEGDAYQLMHQPPDIWELTGTYG